MNEQEIIACCDLGSSKVVCLVGVKKEERVEVIGIGEADSLGIERGLISNIEKTANAILESTKKAFQMASREKKELLIGISGEHLEGRLETGFVAIQNADYEIKETDVKRVVEQAKNKSTSPEKEIIFVHPNYYTVDEQKGIKEPVGMVGMKLEVESYILRAKKTILRTIEKCVERAGFSVLGYVYQPIASSFAVLDEEEKSQGAIVLDIGDGTTDVAIWFEDGLIHTSSLRLGGNLIVNDLAIGLRTNRKKAEEILKTYGVAMKKYAEGLQKITIPGIGGRPSKEVDPFHVAEIVELRAEEILKYGKLEALKSDRYDKLAAGVVLTGGCANLKGIEELSEEVFALPSIVKKNENIGGLKEAVEDPAYTSSVGMLKLGFQFKGQMAEYFKKENIFRKIWRFLKEIY